MEKCITMAMLLHLVLSTCASECGSCSIDDNPYSCTTCPSSNALTYLSSCPNQHHNFQLFIILVAAVTVVHLFMLAMGIGIFRQVFENIQMVSLITWRYGFEGESFALQGTNLAFVRSNDFIQIFGYQFLGLCILLLLFWLALAVVGKISQSPTAILLRRKRIIFPIRVLTFVFNIVLFASLAQLSTTTTSSASIKAIPFALAIIGLISSISTLIFVGVVSNYKKFQVDDPNYYVLVEQMSTKRWWAKNNILISLITRALILLTFVMLFGMPQIAGMIIMALQIAYSVYFIICIRHKKIRYFVVLSANCLILIAVIVASYLGAISALHSQGWNQASQAYLGLYLSLIAIFLIASISELFLRRDLIIKQLKSIYHRFLRCDKSKQDDKIVVSKYDEGSHRERVTQFHKNLLYKQAVEIQMTCLP